MATEEDIQSKVANYIPYDIECKTITFVSYGITFKTLLLVYLSTIYFSSMKISTD